MERYKQTGASPLAVLFLIVLIIFTALIGARIVPLYMGNYQIQSTLADFSTQTIAAGDNESFMTTESMIRRKLLRKLYMSDMRFIKDSDITIAKINDGYRVTVKYNRREKIYGNLDVIADFSPTVDIPNGKIQRING